MELPLIGKVFTSIILIASVIACKEDSSQSNKPSAIPEDAQKEEIAPPEFQSEISECLELSPSIQVMAIASTPEISGSDGDYYLAAGEVAFLEDREYNFNNIYLENNSTINISQQANTDSAFIKIHALGSCDLNGLVNVEGFKGTLEIHCDGQFDSGGELRVSGNRISLLSNGVVITAIEPNSEEEGDEGSSAAISNGNDLNSDGLIDFELPAIVEVDPIVVGDDTLNLPIYENYPAITVIEADATILYSCIVSTN